MYLSATAWRVVSENYVHVKPVHCGKMVGDHCTGFIRNRQRLNTITKAQTAM